MLQSNANTTVPSPVAPYYCYSCGKEMLYSANFCQQCGARLKPVSDPAWLRLAHGCLLLIALLSASSGSIFLLLAGIDAMNSPGSSVVVFSLTGLGLMGLAGGCIYWLIKSQHN